MGKDLNEFENIGEAFGCRDLHVGLQLKQRNLFPSSLHLPDCLVCSQSSALLPLAPSNLAVPEFFPRVEFLKKEGKNFKRGFPSVTFFESRTRSIQTILSLCQRNAAPPP